MYDPQGAKLAYMTGQTLQKYVLPLVGGVQAVFNSSGIWYYRHSDWLGSSRLASIVNQTVHYDGAYAPFGETYAETGSADRSFTGQTQDVIAGSTGIYDFLFRQHSAAQGRWLVPDPAGLAAVDLTDPQTWNRYAYVMNNPLSYTDPLGLDCGSGTTSNFGAGGDLLPGSMSTNARGSCPQPPGWFYLAWLGWPGQGSMQSLYCMIMGGCGGSSGSSGSSGGGSGSAQPQPKPQPSPSTGGQWIYNQSGYLAGPGWGSKGVSLTVSWSGCWQ